MSFVEVYNIRKKYRRVPILRDISFTCEEGECVGIIGSNGCGKSTLLKILQGGLKPDDGKIIYDGKEPLNNSRFFSRYTGYVPQDNPLFANLSVLDNLKLWYCDSSRSLNEDIETGIIREFSLTEHLKKKTGTLSGGQKKRLSIICALAKNPKILILDEPGASLDIVAKNDIVNYMKRFVANKGIVIITSHEDCELAACTRLLVMQNGVLVPFNEPYSSEAVMERIRLI